MGTAVSNNIAVICLQYYIIIDERCMACIKLAVRALELYAVGAKAVA